MNLLFIIDNYYEIKPESNSTLRLIHEAFSRGYLVGLVYPQNLTIRNNVVYGFCKIIEEFKDKKVPANFSTFKSKTKLKEQLLPLRGFDAIFVRKDPPIDSLMLNFLDSISEDILIINSVEGMRKANNKLYTSTFHDPDNKFLPVTYVSKNKEYLKSIIKDSKTNKMILKPLDGYGGSGVIVLEKGATSNISSLLDYYIDGSSNKNYVILQEYVEGADRGDVRVLMLNGEAIGAMKRVPSDGDIRSNVHAGGEAVKHTLTKQEIDICKKIGSKLIEDGLLFVGIDIINGKLIEVNVLSPGGIVNINRLNKTKLQKKILDFVEDRVREKEISINRRLASKEAIKNA